MQTVYILLTRTGTRVSKMIHFIKGGEFTHVSISLLPRTDSFMSFARRKINNPLCGGFIYEDTNKGIFSLYKNSHCKLYAIDLSDDAYYRIKDYITNTHIRHYKQSGYNYLGCFMLTFGIYIKRKYKRTCSQFVAYTLNSSDEIELPKSPIQMLPNDFLKIKKLKMIYDGDIFGCNFENAMCLFQK